MRSKNSLYSALFKRWPEAGLGPFETFLCAALFFVASFESYLVSTVGGVVKYVILFAMLLILYKDVYTKRTTWLDWPVGFFAVWLGYKIITIFWSADLTVPLLHFASQLGMVGLLLALASTDIGERQRGIILGGYFWGSAAFCLLSLVFMEPYELYTQRFVLTLFGHQIDPNNAASIALPAFAIGLYYFSRDRSLLFKCIYGAIGAVAAYVVLMTGSRGGMLALIFTAFVAILFSNDLKVYQKAVITGALVIAVSLVLGLLPEDTYARLFKDDYADGSGRTDLWAAVWNGFLTSPIFGVGWGTALSLTGGMATHNTFLSMLAELGLFGMFFFVAPILYVAAISFRDKNTLPIILLACAVFPALTFDAINKRFLWYGITLALVFCKRPAGRRARLKQREH